jgi:hypothetical protein
MAEFSEYKMLRVLVKNGRVMPGLSGFKHKGDGLTTCYYCGLQLTDELSFARGCGPCCIAEWGPLPGREWIEQYEKEFKAYQALQKRKNLPPKAFKDWLDGRKDEEVIKIYPR